MHTAMRPCTNSLLSGRSFAVRLTHEALPDADPRANFALLTLQSSEGGFVAVDDSGTTWTSSDGREFFTAGGSCSKIAWTKPLPERIDPLDYVAAHLHPATPWPRSTTSRPYLLFVDRVEEGVANCLPLARVSHKDRFTTQWTDHLRVALNENGEFRAGDLIVAADIVDRHEETGPVFYLRQHGIIARAIRAEDVGQILPRYEEGAVEYAAFAEYENAFLVASHRHRPDECVVSFDSSEDGAAPTVLSWSGPEVASLLHPRHPAVWALEHSFHAGQKPGGVWLFSDAQFQMDFDPEDNAYYHWEGNFITATREDLARHGLDVAIGGSDPASPSA